MRGLKEKRSTWAGVNRIGCAHCIDRDLRVRYDNAVRRAAYRRCRRRWRHPEHDLAIDNDGTYTATERRGATAQNYTGVVVANGRRVTLRNSSGRSLSLVHRGVRSRRPRLAGGKVLFDIGE